jgi:hypothetical protein
MDEHRSVVAGQHDVWRPWKAAGVKREPETAPMQRASQEALGPGILGTDTGHHP